MEHYLLRRPNPYRPNIFWYYKAISPLHWTDQATKATFLSAEDAEKIGMRLLEEDVVCEIVDTRN